MDFPINIIWGVEHTQIYNDGYRVVCGDAHPRALGESYDVTWASAWPAIGEPFARALAGETMFLENRRMFVIRNGYLEETFFTFSTSPIRDESGGIGGLFHPVTDTTATMLAERRTRALRDLTSVLGGATDVADLARLAVPTPAGFDLDLPFVLLYALAPDEARYCLAAHHGLEAGTGASPAELPAHAMAPWPIAEAVGSRPIVAAEAGGSIIQGVPCGPYEEPPNDAFVLPASVPGLDRPPLDDVYRGFYELLAAVFSAALATVRAREDERRRAEALAEIDRAKAAFFPNVSHEFRTPLTLVPGPLEESLARGEALPEDERERVALAHRNGQRLLKLVNSLLDFSRIEAARVQASYEPIAIAAFTGDLASNFRSACERAGLGLVIDAPPLLAPVYRIDLLITDLGLPGGMNGRQAADAARRIRPNLKVLLITGYAENALIANGHLEPGMQVMTKPSAMEAFGRRINDLIDSGTSCQIRTQGERRSLQSGLCRVACCSLACPCSQQKGRETRPLLRDDG